MQNTFKVDSLVKIKRAKGFLTYETMIKMHNSLVLPHFTYFFNVWNDGYRAHIGTLYKMQKRAARVITGSSYELGSSEIFERLRWEPTEVTLKSELTILKMGCPSHHIHSVNFVGKVLSQWRNSKIWVLFKLTNMFRGS